MHFTGQTFALDSSVVNVFETLVVFKTIFRSVCVNV